MSSPELVLRVLRTQLRAAGITYKVLAERIAMSESSVKRMFGQHDMSLSRLALICKASGIAMEDVLRGAADITPHADTLTLVQEKSLVAHPRLLLVAICCLGHWSVEQVVETYALTQAECIVCLAELDRLGLIELKPLNRYSLRVSNAFHWLADGPVQQYFREHVVADYFSGHFDGAGETLMCIPARLCLPSAQEMVQKIRQLAEELARLHQSDRRLAPAERDGFTLLLGFRSWEFAAFTALRRSAPAAPPAPGASYQTGPRNR
ncbi:MULTISPECIES: helix-turn-helix domain-containing protein [unclassified Janthinobacterium]|uniref:helix-turn-helix domain-containing protein n=1 Tax=unclassified Janthinobacterium TaxID=2610881 RepID=UPI0008F518B6|nr:MULTISPECIES: helix-turn-helix transcriptional regulator [unclassified Janthinobacterium]APA70589.1 Cro/Cl family transcriptional regulator [Janthinobacterium sp. 1_2014MBL_MicDiv]MDN2711209.1 helix-turn-helix transcriptional regulator [Janthinobacterium sp. SUN118]